MVRLADDEGTAWTSIDSLRAMLQPPHSPPRRPLTLTSSAAHAKHQTAAFGLVHPQSQHAKENVLSPAAHLAPATAIVGSVFKRQPKLPKPDTDAAQKEMKGHDEDDNEIAALSLRIRQRLRNGPMS